MKQLSLMVLGLFIIVSANAQNVINSHFDYLVKNENASNVNVSGKVFQLMNGIDINEEYDEDAADEESKKTREFICSISGFQMVECNELPTAHEHYDNGLKIIDSKYDELVSVEDVDGQFRLYVAETDDVVSEVVGIGNYKDGLMVFSFEGEMRLDQVGEAIENVQKNNFSKVNLRGVNPDDVILYPNPMSHTQQLQIKVPDAMLGSIATIYTTEAKQHKFFNIESTNQTLNVEGTKPGLYIVKLEKDGKRICKKLRILQ